jgi:NhaP-type Na+/H+ or K+/H+ antiporter
VSEGGGSHLLQKAWQAALVVLVTALVARVAWEVLKPLVPGLLIAVILVGIYGFMLKGRRH